MNGRVYDPELGRFLSPDPVVQAPYNTQSYNRYSYVLNNPLSLVDPSGYCYDDTVLLHTMAMDAAEVSVKTAIINYRINLTRNYYRLLNLYRGAVQQYVENFDRYGQSTNFDIGDINIGVSFVKPRSYFDYIGMQFAANGVLPAAQKERLNPFKIVGELFPKWFKSEVIPKFTIYAGGDATLTAFVGGDGIIYPGAGPVGSIGSYFTTDNGISTWETGYPGGDFEFGSYTSVGGALGLDADASLGIGLSFGNLTNFQGAGSSIGIDIGEVSLDITFNGSEQWTGFRFSVNTPLPGISDGVSTTTTRAY